MKAFVQDDLHSREFSLFLYQGQHRVQIVHKRGRGYGLLPLDGIPPPGDVGVVNEGIQMLPAIEVNDDVARKLFEIAGQLHLLREELSNLTTLAGKNCPGAHGPFVPC